MTSGLPPDTAERRRAGVLAPVPFSGWLPFFVVLLGTVLLSVVRGCGRRTRPTADAVCGTPSAGHGRPLAGRNAVWRPLPGVPSPPQTPEGAGCSHIGRDVVRLEPLPRSSVPRTRDDLGVRVECGPVGVVVLRMRCVGIGGQLGRAELRQPRVRAEPVHV